MIAPLIAAALAHAEDAVPQSIGKRHDQYVIVDEDLDIDDRGWGLSMMANEQHVSTRKPRVVYVRHDAMLAALAHLASRVVAERERAERAEARADKAEADAAVLHRAHEAAKTCLIVHAVMVGDGYSGGDDILADRLRDELGALDLDELAKKMIEEEDAAASTRCECEYGCPHGDGCRYVEPKEDAKDEAPRG